MLRVALTGVSHWHAPFYYEPLVRLEGVRLCAVSDPDPGRAQVLAERYNCPWFADYRELLAVARPDFVFALGQHADMPAIGHALIDAGVGFALEKPCGTTLAQVVALRDSASATHVFASVPLAFRYSKLLQFIQETSGADAFCHMSFRFIAGSPQRYIDSGCAWMLDPRRAGGGCTINLAVHFFDIFKLLTGEIPTVVGAAMSNATHGLAIEDYSAVTLTAKGACGVVETGYTLPAPTAAFDLRFSLRSQRYYFTATGADVAGTDHLVTYVAEDDAQVVDTPASQVPYYAEFVRDTLHRFCQDQPPVADLADMCDAMQVLEAAYAAAGWSTRFQEEDRS